MKSTGLFALGLGLFLLAGCGGGGSTSKVIATVNGEDITRDKYLKQLETLTDVMVVINGQRVRARLADPLSSQALNRLVEGVITLQTAKDEVVLPTSAEIQEERDFRVEQAPEYINLMKQQGYTLDDINGFIEIDLAKYNLMVRGVEPKTIEDAKRYVEENPEEFITSAQASFRWVVVTSKEERDKAEAELQQGLTFGAVAGRYSVAQNAQKENGAYPPGGGSTPQPQPLVDSMNPEILKNLKETPEGGRSGWFEMETSSGTYYVTVLLESKTPAQAQTLSDAQLKVLARLLTQREAASVTDLTDLLLDKLLAADIKV